MEIRVTFNPKKVSNNDGHMKNIEYNDKYKSYKKNRGHLPHDMVGCIHYTNVYESCICILCDDDDYMMMMLYIRPV